MRFIGHTSAVFNGKEGEYTVHCSLRKLPDGRMLWVGYIVKGGVMFAMLGDQFKSIEEIYEKAKKEIR